MSEPSNSSAAFIVWSTFADEESAVEVARTLVREKLVACAQAGAAPIRSIYRWQGEVQEERETLLFMKTTAERWPRLRERLEELHPYEVPEIVGCPAQASEPYGAWIAEQVRPGEGS